MSAATVRGTKLGVLVALLCCALAGCGGVQAREDAASRAANRFEASLRAADVVRGCAALAPGTLDGLEQSAELPCARALPDAKLPPATPVRHIDV
ncbi:hypothetical protein [Streptomyces sp. NPDC005865]|uniref:hypothetical protein n=1 Tax=Streptomyces sp. NPDC005865 TaxID=3155453 RepID=UPI0033FC713E